jgi:hypothetical protein
MKGLIIVRDHNNYIVTIDVSQVQIIVYDNELGIYISCKDRTDTIYIKGESFEIEDPAEMHQEFVKLFTFWACPEENQSWPVYTMKNSLERVEKKQK